MNEKYGKLSFRCKNHIISLSLYLPFFNPGSEPNKYLRLRKIKPCIYYANHSSHLDGLVIWSHSAPIFAPFVHPVAAEDYWE